MRTRHRSAMPAWEDAAPPPRRHIESAGGAHAMAFALGGVIALAAIGVARAAHARTPAGPADGAPLMRASLQPVAPVDLQRYAGRWYEQARLPNRFEKTCAGQVTADYTPLPDGTVHVLNRCEQADGRIDEAAGIARTVAVSGLPGAGRLKVRFAPSWLAWVPFAWGDYWILRLDRDYQVSLVGTPDRQYLWVLSRAPVLDAAALQAELDYARSLGFDVDRVVRSSSSMPEPAPAL